jgi:hypothetical protein
LPPCFALGRDPRGVIFGQPFGGRVMPADDALGAGAEVAVWHDGYFRGPQRVDTMRGSNDLTGSASS